MKPHPKGAVIFFRPLSVVAVNVRSLQLLSHSLVTTVLLVLSFTGVRKGSWRRSGTRRKRRTQQLERTLHSRTASPAGTPTRKAAVRRRTRWPLPWRPSSMTSCEAGDSKPSTRPPLTFMSLWALTNCTALTSGTQDRGYYCVCE